MLNQSSVADTRKNFLRAGVAAALVWSAPVLAQEAAPVSDGFGGALMDDILVTATKRAGGERAQDVPASITAFGAEQLEVMQFRSLESISFSAPNVQLDDVGSIKGTANFVIRGLGVNSSVPSIEPTVATVINGIYLGTNNGTIFDATDIESIEVLRGPQGVLFGRNVTGGAVLVRSRRPGNEVDGNIRASVESGLRGAGAETTVAGAVGGALVRDQLMARVAGYYSYDSGYYRNVSLDRNDGKARSWMIRPTLVVQPAETLDITVIGEYGRTKGDGSVNSNPAGTVQAPKFGTKSGDPGTSDMKYHSVVLEVNWDVGPGDGQVTNIFGYRDYDVMVTSDNDGALVDYFRAQSYIAQNQVSNELRYSVRVADRVDFVTGVFLFDQFINYQSYDNLLGRVGQGGGIQRQKSWGVFANANVDLTDRLTIGAGGRYSEDRKRVNIASRDFSANSPCTFQKGCSSYNFNDRATFDSFTPRAFLRYKFGDDSQAYAQYSRGVRAGGYNLRAGSLIAPPGPFNDETANSYEIGIKSRLFDRRVMLNVAVFQNDIDDIQREQTAVTLDGVTAVLGNAGDIRIRGFEAESSVRLFDGLIFQGTVGYVDGKYTSVYADLNGDGLVDDRDLGLKIPRLAPWTFSAGLFYDRMLGTAGNFTANVNFEHRDGSPFADNNSTFLPSVDLLSVNLGFEPTAIEGLRLSIYGRNLLDSRGLGANADVSILPTGGYFQTVQKGKLFGFEASFSF